MGLAGDDELHRPAGIGQQPQQPGGIVQQQVRPLVRRETAGKAERQYVRVEQMLRLVDHLGRRARRRPIAATDAPRERIRPRLARPSVRSCQSRSSGTRRMSRSIVSIVPSQRSFPQDSIQSASAASESQLGMWTPLVTCPTGTSSSGQCGKSGAKMCRLTHSVQAADAVDRPAAANRQVGHVERLGRIVRVLAAQAPADRGRFSPSFSWA